MKITIADIAEKAGVSKATVSRVLNKRPEGVGEQTRARIEAIVSRVRERTAQEGGQPDVMETVYRALMEACIAYEHQEFARLREPKKSGE